MTRWGQFDDLYRISDLDKDQIPVTGGTGSQEGQYQTLINEETFLANIMHES